MLDRFINQGRVDAMARFKVSMSLGTAGANPVRIPKSAPLSGGGRFNPPPAAAAAAAPAAEAAAAGGGDGGMMSGLMDKAKTFGSGQLGAAKDLFGNLRQGLGGAATPELGALARGNALGNLKTLAPSLLAGGGLYMMHKHKEREQQARQQMMQGGY